MKIFRKVESERWNNRYENVHTLIFKEMVLLKPLKLPPDTRKVAVRLWRGCAAVRRIVY